MHARKAILHFLILSLMVLSVLVFQPAHAGGAIISQATGSACSTNCTVALTGVSAGDIIVAAINGYGSATHAAFCTPTYSVGASDTFSDTYAVYGGSQLFSVVGAGPSGTCIGGGVVTTTAGNSGSVTVTISAQAASTSGIAIAWDTSGYGSAGAAVAATGAGNSLGGSPTVITNTNVMGATSNNGTGYYLTRNTFYFYASQNTQSNGLIDNVTIKVAALKMNVTQGSLYFGFYTSAGIPSLGNPWTLISTQVVPLFNTTSGFIKINPQVNIAVGAWFAVGIMASPEGHSRGGGAANSGVSVYLTSTAMEPQYYYAPAVASGAAQIPPQSFYSSTTQGHSIFQYVHETYTVFTATATTSVTVGGTATTTSTVTSTNVINQLNLASANFWFLPLLFLLAPMGLLIAVKRYATR
jgi:hypothetical protein